MSRRSQVQCSAVRLRVALALLMTASGVNAAATVPVCAPEVVGTWKLVTSTQPESMLLHFAPDGWANVLSGPAEKPAESFEIVAQVRYSHAPLREPKRVEFQTSRGNDLFASGKSHWLITAFTDESLTTQPSDTAAGEQWLWSRVQTQRYFLTFAGRDRSAQQDPAAFIMWTTLGRKTALEALGLTGANGAARLGRIPQKLAADFAKHSGRSDDVMMRIEISEAEYHRSHRVLESWDAVLKGDRLARNDPAAQFNEMFDAALQSVNRCGPKLKVPTAISAESASQTAAGTSMPMQRIRELRKLNDKRHVGDKVFPFAWKPPAAG
jgi:hypothetical protein